MQSLILTFLRRPRATFKSILRNDANFMRAPLIIGYGIYFTLQRAEAVGINQSDSLATQLLGLLLGTIFLGVIMTVILSALTVITGRVMGGFGSYTDCQSAFLWGHIPNILWAMPLLVMSILDNGSVLTFSHSSNNLTSITLNLITVSISIWCLIIHNILISEAHHFSKLKAFWAQFLTIGIIFIPFIIVRLSMS